MYVTCKCKKVEGLNPDFLQIRKLYDFSVEL